MGFLIVKDEREMCQVTTTLQTVSIKTIQLHLTLYYDKGYNSVIFYDCKGILSAFKCILAHIIPWWEIKVVSDLVKSVQSKLPRADFKITINAQHLH